MHMGYRKGVEMSFRITSGQANADGVRRANETYRSLLRTMERLSSGLRINRASDDPAGLVISENLRARVASLNQEIENTTMSIRKCETADGAISGLRSLLVEMRTQALGASNEGFNMEATQSAYQAVAQNAAGSYNRMIETAEYNGRNLFDGADGSVSELSRLAGIDLSSPSAAAEAIGRIDNAMAELDAAQNDIGSKLRYDLVARRSNLEVTAQNLTASESQIRDADYTLEIANMVRDEITLKAGMALLAHSHVTQKSVLTLLK